MKNIILKSLGVLLIAGSLTSCGSEFLKTEMSNGVDVNTALNSVANVGNALNGTYYQFFRYYFAGNYGTVIGDIASESYTGMARQVMRMIYISSHTRAPD